MRVTQDEVNEAVIMAMKAIPGLSRENGKIPNYPEAVADLAKGILIANALKGLTQVLEKP